MESVDVVIVGARCAGSAAASTFARAGRRVVVLDRARFPSETISSHTIFGAGIGELRAIGALVRVRELDPPPLPTFHVELSGTGEPVSTYRQSTFDEVEDQVISVPRALLDDKLVETAAAAGAEVRQGCTVTEILWRGGRAAGVVYTDPAGARQTVSASLILGADGQFSTIADLVGVTTPYRFSHSPRCAVYRYLKDPAADPDATTVYHWRDGTSMGFAFPTTPRGTIIVMFVADRSELDLARRDPELYWQRKLAEHPAAAQRLEGATDATPLRTTDKLASFFRASSGPGWALIGDAGHFKDPIIGQGIRDALWAGRTIAEQTSAVLDAPVQLDRTLREWEYTRDRECRLPYLVGVYESRLVPDSAGVRSVAGVLSRFNLPLVEAFTARDGTIRRVATPGVMVRAVTAALKESGNARAAAKELLVEGVLAARMFRAGRRRAFRDTRMLSDLENIRGGWPRVDQPVAASPPQPDVLPTPDSRTLAAVTP